MLDLTATTVIIHALLERPGQSKYSLASSLLVPPTVLENQLAELESEDLVVHSEVPGDDEPVFWASKRAADLEFVEPNGGGD
jgi:DNA-binding HxlR family transcriptional regulator